ncbi:hypothetical protein ACP26L_36515 (plasmid) [Paenibacillus sp. S-38]|uniref:hypothetical protein n=1 Tax=Paenibacillus sp. S-38 TaxID=3416710 RepID=UPI003CF1A96E
MIYILVHLVIGLVISTTALMHRRSGGPADAAFAAAVTMVWPILGIIYIVAELLAAIRGQQEE